MDAAKLSVSTSPPPTLAPTPAVRVSSPSALLLSPADTAARLGISRATLWRYDARGLIPAAVRVGATVRWSAKALEDWVAKGCPSRPPARH